MEHIQKELTYWNGEPAVCRRCIVTIADDLSFPKYWAREEGRIGEKIEAVEVTVPNAVEPFYISNIDLEGWIKVTEGKGGWWYSHKSVCPSDVQEITYLD